MKKAYLLVFSTTFIFISAVHADTQVNLYDTDWPNYAYTITGSYSDTFDLYLNCLSPDASIWNASDVHVADLGITPQQHHLYQVQGQDGQPFWSSGSSIEVLDSSMSRVGLVNTMLDPILWADAGAPYKIAAGQSVSFNSSQSCIAWDYGWNPATSLRIPSHMDAQWKIDGKSVSSLVTFDDLVTTLGLSYGLHTVQLDAYAFYGDIIDFHQSAYTTIEIIPEPATILLLSLASLFLRKENRR